MVYHGIGQALPDSLESDLGQVGADPVQFPHKRKKPVIGAFIRSLAAYELPEIVLGGQAAPSYIFLYEIHLLIREADHYLFSVLFPFH